MNLTDIRTIKDIMSIYNINFRKEFGQNFLTNRMIPEDIADSVYIAGAKRQGDSLLTNGGRVLGVTSGADSLEEAIEESYKKVERITFKGAYYRHDIGKRALAAYEE